MSESKKLNIYEKLNSVQVELNAPKNLYNKFAGYAYRNCEGILAGLKPLLEKYGLTIVMSDQVAEINGKTYIIATATLTDIETKESVSNTAAAREGDQQKGLTPAQITGSCSSYARKYALNGLLAIDDVQDDDSRDNTGKDQQTGNRKEPSEKNIMDLRDQLYF